MDLGMGLGLSRGDGNVGGGATPHPLAGSGMTWWSAEDSDLFEDTSGTDPIEGVDGETVKRINVSEGGGYAYHSDAGTNYKYGAGDGSHAINGKPTVYVSGVNGLSTGMGGDVGLGTLLADGKTCDVLMVLRRVDTDNNQSVFAVGGLDARQYTASNNLTIYGFFTGYMETSKAAAVGVHVVHIQFSSGVWSIAIDGGTPATMTQDGSGWSNGTAPLKLGQADIDYACMGIYDGLHGDVAGLVTDLKTYYGIA